MVLKFSAKFIFYILTMHIFILGGNFIKENRLSNTFKKRKLLGLSEHE